MFSQLPKHTYSIFLYKIEAANLLDACHASTGTDTTSPKQRLFLRGEPLLHVLI
jgi:hypothetical protein